MIVAIDFGITNTDIAVSNGGALDFFSFKTNLPIEESNILAVSYTHLTLPTKRIV